MSGSPHEGMDIHSSRVIRYNIRVDPSNQASQFVLAYSETLMTNIISAYLESLKNPVRSTNQVNIVIRPAEGSPSVKVFWGLSEKGTSSSSNSLGSSHQVYFPEEVGSREARRRQLFVLGNILLKICESETGTIEGLELYRELENGMVPANVRMVTHWPFIYSSLSFKFAKRAFVEGATTSIPSVGPISHGPSTKSKSALQKLAVGGSVMAAACFGVPLLIAAAGFSASGVVGGSLAAGWQSSIGAVASGSLFSGLQSMAATGFLGLQTAGVVSGAVAAGAAGASRVRSSPPTGRISYRYLYDSDLNDMAKLNKLVDCKRVIVFGSA